MLIKRIFNIIVELYTSKSKYTYIALIIRNIFPNPQPCSDLATNIFEKFDYINFETGCTESGIGYWILSPRIDLSENGKFMELKDEKENLKYDKLKNNDPKIFNELENVSYNDTYTPDISQVNTNNPPIIKHILDTINVHDIHDTQDTQCQNQPKIRKNSKYVLLLHGTGDNRKSFCQNYKIEKLIKSGYTIMIPDYRSFGDSPGEFITENLNTEIQQCINEFNEHIKINISKDEKTSENQNKLNKITIVGVSLGRSIALQYILYYLKNRNTLISINTNVILFAPFLSIRSVMNNNQDWCFYKRYIRKADEKITDSFEIDSIDILHGINDLNSCINGYKNEDNNGSKNEDNSFLENRNIKKSNEGKPFRYLILYGRDDYVVPECHVDVLANVLGGMLVKKEGCDHTSIFLNEDGWNLIEEFI